MVSVGYERVAERVIDEHARFAGAFRASARM